MRAGSTASRAGIGPGPSWVRPDRPHVAGQRFALVPACARTPRGRRDCPRPSAQDHLRTAARHRCPAQRARPARLRLSSRASGSTPPGVVRSSRPTAVPLPPADSSTSSRIRAPANGSRPEGPGRAWVWRSAPVQILHDDHHRRGLAGSQDSCRSRSSMWRRCSSARSSTDAAPRPPRRGAADAGRFSASGSRSSAEERPPDLVADALGSVRPRDAEVAAEQSAPEDTAIAVPYETAPAFEHEPALGLVPPARYSQVSRDLPDPRLARDPDNLAPAAGSRLTSRRSSSSRSGCAPDEPRQRAPPAAVPRPRRRRGGKPPRVTAR